MTFTEAATFATFNNMCNDEKAERIAAFQVRARVQDKRSKRDYWLARASKLASRKGATKHLHHRNPR